MRRNSLNSVAKQLSNNTSSFKTPKGYAGYDNARENIDPHIKTQVVSSKEIAGSPIFTGGGLPFTDIHIADGTTAQAIATGTTYQILTAWNENGESNNCTPDSANNKITINVKGRYLVNSSINASSGTPNVTFKITAFLDGAELHQVHMHRKFSSAGDMGSGAMTGIINVPTVPLDLDVRVRHDNGGSVNITPSYMNLNVIQIGG